MSNEFFLLFITESIGKNVIFIFKVMGQGHGANVLKPTYHMDYLSKGVDFDMHGNIINHKQQNVTWTFKVKGQGHSANALQLYVQIVF